MKKLSILLFLVSLNLWSAPSDYHCDTQMFKKEKIIAIGGCSTTNCAVKTQSPDNKSVLNKRMVNIENAFVGDEINITNEKCVPNGYDTYLESASKAGNKILSPDEWHKKVEANKSKYGKSRRFVAEKE